MFWHVVEVLREWAWYGATNRVLYSGDDVVGRLVEGAQEKVREESGGTEFVSTGDVLVVWVLKARTPLF